MRRGAHRKITPAATARSALTVAPEHVDVQLLEEVHDEGVDLRQQSHEEDDGEAEGEDCAGTKAWRRVRGSNPTEKKSLEPGV